MMRCLENLMSLDESSSTTQSGCRSTPNRSCRSALVENTVIWIWEARGKPGTLELEEALRWFSRQVAELLGHS